MAGVAVRLPPPVLLEALPSSVAGEVQTRRIHDAAARAQWDLVYKEAVLSQQKSWAALHSGHWASVDVACRTAYAVACFYVATAGVEIARHRTATEELATSQKQADLIDVLKDGLRHADMGLMLGDTTCRRPLLELATRLENALAGLRRDRDEISACTAATHCSETPSAIPSAPCLDSHAIRLLTGSMQPLRLREPSLPYFYNECMEPARPAVLLGAMQDWPAMGSRRWTFNYLIQMAGHRTVPVEIGRHYLSDDFDEKLMNLREFILRFVIRTAAREMQDFDYPGKAVRGCKNTAPFGHMEPQDDGGPRTPCAREFRESPTMADPTLRESPTMADPTRLANAILPANVRGSDEDGRKELREENTASVDPDQGRGSGRGLQKESSPSEWGYLAQHQLFLQIPQLRRDIAVPDYCSLSLEDEDSSSSEASMHGAIINAWLGPPGTVSPLHHDRYHNLLAQVIGCKYIRLYPPEERGRLYPHISGPHKVSSRVVDIDHVDRQKFPLFAEAPYCDVLLGEGEMLYIPPGWWHYVEAQTASFSVSFWWT